MNIGDTMTIIIISIILFVILLLMFIVGLIVNNMTLHPKRLSYEEVYKAFNDIGFADFNLNDYDFEEVFIQSDYNYKLFGKWFANKDSKKTVIISHGYTANLMESMRFLDLYYSNGFNVLVYDHRYHGKSGGKNCSFGYYEYLDIKKCIDWTSKKTGKDSIVGLHGESMGGAASILAASEDNRVSFVVSDCSFSDLFKEIKYFAKKEFKYFLPPFLYIASFINLLRTGHTYQKVSPIKALSKLNIPILFIHGENDLITPCCNSVLMHQKYQGKKELFITKNTGHAESVHNHKKDYYMRIKKFLNDLNL